MLLLELFTGTKSADRTAKQLKFEATSLDLKTADMNTNNSNLNYMSLTMFML